MATYSVTYTDGDDWGEPENRYKTRPPADARLEEARLDGRFARLIRWEGGHPSEVARVNAAVQPPCGERPDAEPGAAADGGA